VTTTPATTPARRQAPYEVLSSRDALLEAAKLNRDMLELMGEGGSAVISALAQASLSLATYALALDRWSP
jgi:hypothetical protein